MRKKIQHRINIDKLKLCYVQPDKLVEALIEQKGSDGVIDYGDYQLFILDHNDKELVDIDKLTAMLILKGVGKDGSNVKLGSFNFSNSGKYQGRCFFSFANEALYFCNSIIGGEKYNLMCYLNHVTEQLGLNYNNITEIEIAVDINFNMTRVIRHFVRLHHQYKMYVNGNLIKDPKARIKNYFEVFGRTREHLETTPSLYVKQIGSGIPLQLKTYNKTEEIEEESPQKQYVKEWNGFPEKDVTHRMEVTIGNVDFRQWNDFLRSKESTYSKEWADHQMPLDLLMTEEYRWALWVYATNRLLYFADRKNHERITLIDILGGSRPL